MFDPFGTKIRRALFENPEYLAQAVGLKREGNLLTPHEIIALDLCSQYFGNRYFIASQVHLLQIFDIDEDGFEACIERLLPLGNVPPKFVDSFKSGTRGILGHMIGKKSVDLLITDRQSSKIVGGIEVDGDSHDNSHQQWLDYAKNLLFLSADLPLLRITNAEVAAIRPIGSINPVGLDDALRQVRAFGTLLQTADARWKAFAAQPARPVDSHGICRPW